MSQSILTNSNLECRSTGGAKPTLLKLAFTDANLRLEGATSGTKVVLDNVAEPTQAAHASTKAYVDNAVSGISMGLAWKDAVQVRSTENFDATYSGGTLTASTAGFFPQTDGQGVNVNDRVLVMNQTDAAHNGVYKVSVVGDNNTAWQMDRAADASSVSGASDIRRGAVFVDKGTTYGGRGYVESGNITTLGTDDVNYSLMATISEVSATDGLEASGKNIKVKTGRGIGIISDEVALNDLGVETGYLADGAVETSKIADGAVSAVKLSTGCIDNSNKFLGGVVDGNAIASASVSAVKMANKTITANQITNSTLTTELFADDSVDSSKLAPNAVDTTAIADGSVSTAKIASGAVGTTQLATGSVSSSIIGSGAVASANLATGSVITSKIPSGNITTALLNQTSGSEAITTACIRASQITKEKMADDSVGADQIIAQSVGEPALANACIQDRHIGSLSNLTLSGELVASSVVVGGSGGSTSYSLAKVSHLNYNFTSSWDVPASWGLVPAADSKLEFPYSDKVSALNFTAILPLVRTNDVGTDVELAVSKRLWNTAGTALEAATYDAYLMTDLQTETFSQFVANTLITKSSGGGGDNYVGEVSIVLQKSTASSAVSVPVQGDLQMIGFIVSEHSGTTQLTYSV